MIQKSLKKEITRQGSLFLLVGLISTIINYGVFFMLFQLFSVYYLLASAIGYISGMVFGYFYNKNYTFRSNERIKKSFTIYLIIYLFSLILSLVLLNIFVENFYINPLIVNFFVLIITTFINFFGTKLIAFKNKDW